MKETPVTPEPEVLDAGRIVPVARLATTPLDYTRVYRAFVSADHHSRPERTFFVEAPTDAIAMNKIVGAVLATEPWRKPDEVRDAIYNCDSASECIGVGESDDLELRLFEIGWGGGEPPRMCPDPVFLVPRPGDWALKWAAARSAQPL